MIKTFLFVVFLFAFIGCSSRPANQQQSGEPTTGSFKLDLSASPRQGFAPLHITFQANLSAPLANDEKHYCLQEQWDFGDGAKSTEKPNCDPFNASSKIKTEFFGDHVYEREGNYTVRLLLGDEGPDQIRSRQVSIVVIERSLNPN